MIRSWCDLTPLPGTSNATGKSLALMPGQSQRDCVLNALDEIEFRGLDELHELTGISKDSLSSRLSKMHKAKMIERTVREIPEAKRTPGSNSRRNVYRRGRLAK